MISGYPVWFMLKRMAADRKIIAEHRWITRCLNVVLRFRWFDREPSSQSISADWRFAALIIATLFLNLHFWQTHGDDVWMSCSILPYAFIVAAVAIAITTLFFLGPAAITQSMNRSLLCAVENSLGPVPAFGVRLCFVSFLVIWMANSIAVPGLWWVDSILRREVSSSELGIMAVGIVAFVFATGLQSTKTTANLAMFTDKLGIAILLAAMLRVHEGWPDAVNGFPHGDVDRSLSEFWQGISRLMFYTAPLGFLAGSFGNRVQGRRQLALTAAMGFALPLFVTLLLIGVMNVATIKSPIYQPSLNPNVPMALWAHAARSSLPGRMLLVAITLFGALRFGVRALAESVSTVPVENRPRWTRLVGLSLAIAWFSVHQGAASLSTALEVSTACLVGAIAVLSADCLTQRWRSKQMKRIDWVGLVALLTGLACVPCWKVITGAEPWSRTWVLPSYVAGFTICLLGRFVQKHCGTSPSVRLSER